MKSSFLFGLALAATVGSTQAAQAPDMSNCSNAALGAAAFILAPLETPDPVPRWASVPDVAPATLVADATGETGAATAPADAPKVDTPADVPKTEAPAEAPKADVPADAPKPDTAVDAPKPEAQAATPAALNIYSETGPDKLAPATSGALTRVYVPNHTSNTVTVIDPATHKVIETYKAGLGPQHIIPSFDLKTLWVANTANQTVHGSVAPIDPTTGKLGQPIPVDDPYNMYFTPDGAEAIVVAEAYRKLDLRDAQTMQLKSSIPTPMCEGLNHADYTADFKYLIFTCEFGGVRSGLKGQEARKSGAGASLIRVDLKAGTVVDTLTFSMPGMPQDIRLSPDGKTFFVTDMINDGVFLVDADTFKETGFITTGKGAHGLNVSRDGKFLYVANRGSNRMPDRGGGPGSVSVINFETHAVEHTWMIPGGGSPDMGNVTLDGKELWLSGRYDGQVYAINTENGDVTKINVGVEPHGLTLWPQPGRYSLGHTGNMR